ATDLALFADAALEQVAALSHGIPRVINVLCDAALLTAFATGAKQVTPAVIDEAWRDYAPAVAPESEPQAVAIAPAAAGGHGVEPSPAAAPQVLPPVEPVFSVAAALAAAVESALATPAAASFYVSTQHPPLVISPVE